MGAHAPLKALAIAFNLLSIFPIKIKLDKKSTKFAIFFFPLVSIFNCALAIFICFLLKLPEDMSALILLLSLFILSGGLTKDGFCDTTDALYAHFLKGKDFWEVLKDPRIGFFASCGLFFLLFVKFLSIKEVINQPLLILFVEAARGVALTTACILFPPAKQGLGELFLLSLKSKKKFLATLPSFYLLPFLFFIPKLIFLVFLNLIICISLGFSLTKRLKGLNGDILGFICEICSIILYISILKIKC